MTTGFQGRRQGSIAETRAILDATVGEVAEFIHNLRCDRSGYDLLVYPFDAVVAELDRKDREIAQIEAILHTSPWDAEAPHWELEPCDYGYGDEAYVGGCWEGCENPF